MHLVLVTYGTDGDTRPMLALARGLQAAGHQVRLIGDESGADLAAAEGVEFTALPGSLKQIMESDTNLNKAMRSGRVGLGEVARTARRTARDWLPVIDAAAAEADVIIGSSVAVYHAISVGESRGIPRFAAGFQPYLPTADWPPTLLGVTGTPRWLNRPLTAAVNRLIWLSIRAAVNAGRSRLGQPRVWREWSDYSALGAWSPTLVSTPTDWATDRRGHRLTVTGDWPLRSDSFTPSAELADFLAGGDPPLFVGFGSMTGFGQETSLVHAVVTAAAGRRLLLSSGWAALGRDSLPDNVFVLGHTPHDWLFPRCAAVLHHCGAGTTHTAARAGVATVPVPIVADQPFWAGRLQALGLATPPVDRHRLDVHSIAAAITAATSPQMRDRADEVAQVMAAEDGVGKAVAAIESAVACG